jgi:hypothetical protein
MQSAKSYLDGIVKDFCSRMKNEIFQRHNFWSLPSAQSAMICSFEHMIGEDFAKLEIIGIGLRL